MKTKILSLLAFAFASRGLAVTHAVLPGESIQAKVDLAAPGDIVAISGGTYAGDVTVNKAIRLVEMDGHEVTITGNVTLTGVTHAPPFEGFTVGSPGKGITVTDTTGLVIKNVDARPGFGLKTTGVTSVSVIGGYSSNIDQQGGELNLVQAQITGSLTSNVACTKTIALRSQLGSVTLNSQKSWLGYCSGSTLRNNSNNGAVRIVGCSFTGSGYATVLLLGGSGNNYLVTNCNITGLVWGTGILPGDIIVYQGESSTRVLAGNTALIANNYIKATNNTSYQWDFNISPAHQGAGIVSDGGNCTAINNIIMGHYRGIIMPFGTIAGSCYVSVQGFVSQGGVVPVNLITSGAPGFVSGQEPKLDPASQLINAGVVDPIYNDLNATRNDIGPGGGCLFDPQGWTTNKPVVISFDLAPQQLLRGVDTQVNLSRGLAVGQP